MPYIVLNGVLKEFDDVFKTLYAREMSVKPRYAHRATDLIEYFGSGAAAARALKMKSRAIVSYWLSHGNRVPELRARQAHELTGGKLKFDPKAYE